MEGFHNYIIKNNVSYFLGLFENVEPIVIAVSQKQDKRNWIYVSRF